MYNYKVFKIYFGYSKSKINLKNGIQLFLKISSVNDCAHLQEDHNNFVDWSVTLCLKLNIKKFKSIVFTRNRSPTSFSHCVNGVSLFLTDADVCDIDFTSIPPLCPQAHINKVTCKVLDSIK